ncbi:LemA family protein [Salinimicrobium tongyeongense]|jgi:LemA protein|uniref:LemA family protein n=1 Tax=Salinimicrobium tongyeongense TaxID=2809707 RepID=A0ABY6NTI3_9FLAO|nr:LemA family protein [Salinimicrobium tongyeongense]UZH56222.1 LemA family protein [Salinimicrobium tongyeongense]
MKKWLVPVLIIGAIVLGLYLLTVGKYNNAVVKQETAQTAWSQVESAYQRRSDLIPNLVNTVKGAADFERGTLTDVIEARAKATSVNVDASNITQENLQQFQQAQGEVSSALSRLLVTVERYPELRATQNFQQLQSQLEGTENRINVERNRYNEQVRDYNTYIRKFPNNLIVGMYGFERMPLFEADPGSESAPEVDFDS